MKVKELIEFLQASDPEAIVIAPFAFQGFTEVLTVERKLQGGFDDFPSFEEVSVVELNTGNYEYMRSQGRDVVGVPKYRDYRNQKEK